MPLNALHHITVQTDDLEATVISTGTFSASG